MGKNHLQDPTDTPVDLTDPGAVAAAAGGDGMQVDLAQLRSALAQLQQQYDAFSGTVSGAAGLADDLPLGHGPTASLMTQLYRDRLGGTAGVQAVLSGHMAAIGKIADNLSATIGNYQSVEQSATQSMRDPGDGAVPE